MFYTIGNINPASKTIETEAVDSHLEDRGRSGQEQNAEQGSDNDGLRYTGEWENELTELSVDALIRFLEDCLETRLTSQVLPEPTKVDTTSPWMKTEHSNTNDSASKNVLPRNVANAYAHGAKAVKISSTYQSKDTESKSPTSNQTKNKIVYHLIRDLRDLKTKGLTSLRIDNTKGSFLKSIEKSVNAEISARAILK